MQLTKASALLALALLGGCRPGEFVTPAPPAPTEAPPAVELAAPELPAPPRLAREFRAAWISPVWGGEWPSRSTLTPEQQRAELSNLLDRAQRAGLNAVVLHVRMAADALYPGRLAPWSVYLTGTSGQGPVPAYDPLAFAIEEAHRRGLELHAWFNPFRAAPPDRRQEARAGHVISDRPEWVVRYGAQQWIDPGIPAAREAVLDAMLDVVERYDIDGIHLDDYFYPYREQRTVRRTERSGGRTRTVTVREDIPFPDSVSWRRYGGARFASRADWRRANIDDFVETLYREVKARRPWVRVGISPFGIWRPGHPPGITGLDAYGEIYADALRWWREGWVDYLAPQLYWPLDGVQSRFTRLDAWWREQNVRHRHLWPGLHTSRETEGREPWPAGEIVRQVEWLRAARADSDESLGHIHFRLQALRPAARGGIGETLRTQLYAEPALTPPVPWLERNSPEAPRATVEPDAVGTGVRVRIAPGGSTAVRWWLVQVLVGEQWESRLQPATLAELRLDAPSGASAIALSAIGRTGLQSLPVVHLLR